MRIVPSSSRTLPRPAQGLLSAVLVAAITAMLYHFPARLFFDVKLHSVRPYGLAYLVTVALLTMLGGRRLGVLTLFLALIGALYLLPPRSTIYVADLRGWMELTGLLLLGVATVLGAEKCQWPAGRRDSASTDVSHATLRKRVFVHGAYGNGNSGDDAILLSLLTDLESAVPGIEFTVLSIDEGLTRALLADRVNVRVITGRLRSAHHVWNNLRVALSADLYVFGGGGILGDMLTSLMAGLLVRASLVRAMGGHTMVYAVGADPIRSPFNRQLMRLIGVVVDSITVRDEQSRKYLVEAGLRAEKVLTTADPAFSLLPAPPAHVRRLLAEAGVAEDRRPLFGIALVHELSMAQQDVFARAADRLIAEHDCQVVFLPFERHNDLPMSETVVRRMRQSAAVLRGEYHPSELRGLAGGMDLLIGMRFHSLLFGASAGVPLIAVSFVPKTVSLMRALGQEQSVMYCGWMARQRGVADFTGEELAECVGRVWRRRESVTREMIDRAEVMRSGAKQNAALAASLLKR